MDNNIFYRKIIFLFLFLVQCWIIFWWSRNGKLSSEESLVLSVVISSEVCMIVSDLLDAWKQRKKSDRTD